MPDSTLSGARRFRVGIDDPAAFPYTRSRRAASGSRNTEYREFFSDLTSFRYLRGFPSSKN